MVKDPLEGTREDRRGQRRTAFLREHSLRQTRIRGQRNYAKTWTETSVKHAIRGNPSLDQANRGRVARCSETGIGLTGAGLGRTRRHSHAKF